MLIQRDINNNLAVSVKPTATATKTGLLSDRVVSNVSLVDDNKISGIGSLSTVPGGLVSGQKLPSVVTFSYTNVGLVTETLLMFDSLNLVDAKFLAGITPVVPTATNLGTNAIAKQYFMTRPMMFKGFNYEVSNVSQQANDIRYYVADADSGNYNTLTPAAFQRNTPNNPRILTFVSQILVTAQTGIAVDVLAGETVTFSFYPDIAYNSVIGQ